MMPTTRRAGTARRARRRQEQQERQSHPDHAVGELARCGGRTMIQTGSIEPIQLDGAVQPKMDQFIRSSE